MTKTLSRSTFILVALTLGVISFLNVAGMCTPALAASQAIVRDDGNNLREFGGRNYKKARIIGVLNQGDVVTVHQQKGRWSEVTTESGVHGWVHSGCLKPLPQGRISGSVSGSVGSKTPSLQTCSVNMPRRFTADLNGDGRPEFITLVDVPDAEGGGARLEVHDENNQLLWRGPDASGIDGGLYFFCRDWGIYWPAVIGDIDGDGEVELLSQEPQSDVSPSTYFLARWMGNAFVPVSRGWALLEHPYGSGRFVQAQYTYSEKPVTWIMDVESLTRSGDLKVSIFSYAGGEMDEERTRARMTPDGRVRVVE